MFAQYRNLCERGEFSIGMLWLYKSPNKWILNFPTKKHWRQPSRIEFIEAGLKKFVETYDKLSIHSIAFPPLGCGNGQLDFESQVRPLMDHYLRNLPIEVFIYADRNSSITPEHEKPDNMGDWLRTEPTNLPFSEVWDDLCKLLEEQSSFKTAANNNPFTAKITNDIPGIEISSSGSRYHVAYETLLTFWQQLRTHGFSMRSIAPDLSREIYYLTPIFAALEYVKTVYMAEDYSKLTLSPIIGLQVLPLAFSNNRLPKQLTLFSESVNDGFS
jgi:hypothetical protein